MPKRYIQNDGEHTLFVGGVMIPPGQGREVDEPHVSPAADAPAVGEAGTPDPDADAQAATAALAELQAQPVRDLLPKLDALTPDDLAALAALEQSTATPRVTLLSAISKLQLDRAQAAGGGAPA